jgi:hypothetical protein
MRMNYRSDDKTLEIDDYAKETLNKKLEAIGDCVISNLRFNKYQNKAQNIRFELYF